MKKIILYFAVGLALSFPPVAQSLSVTIMTRPQILTPTKRTHLRQKQRAFRLETSIATGSWPQSMPKWQREASQNLKARML